MVRVRNRIRVRVMVSVRARITFNAVRWKYKIWALIGPTQSHNSRDGS